MAARVSAGKRRVHPAPTPATRVEHDALGSVTLPGDALYGIHTARALENLRFTTRSLGSCPPYLHALGTVKRAAARANREADVLTARLADAIEVATAPLLGGQLLDQFPADLLGGGGSIGVHMNVNEVVANLASEHLGGRRGESIPVHPFRHVNASQSTADVCHTALRLAVLNQWKALRHALGSTVQTLRDQADQLGDVPTLSRTCLQDALPATLGVLFSGYAALLQRRTGDLERAIYGLRAVALGGTVIGTGDGAPLRYRERVVAILSEIAGWALVRREPTPDALQNSDDVAAVSAQLALLAQALIKIAQDLRLLASGPQGGFGEIDLPHVQAGSSFFSGKQNPVIPETVLQCAFQVLGCDRTVQAAVEHAELYLNIFDGLAAVNVLDAIDMLAGAVGRFETRCLRGLRANKERCGALAAFGKRV